MMDKSKVDLPIGIPEFYKGKSILLTGFTGTIGKLLVEKLLYSCPELKKIYILVRAKKDQSPDQRVQNAFTSMAFTRLHEKYPDSLKTKVVGLAGDMVENRLGLSHEDEELLRTEVSIIIHGAACVRFEEPLDIAVKINTLGTKKMVDLALTMPHLICLTYISTAYTNCDNFHIKEEIYPPKADWRKTLQICDKINTETLQTLSAKYIDKMPNTYSFSKSLAEQIINDYRDQLPVVIVRPSMVIYSWKEPMIGWIDNKYGPIGYRLGLLLGLIRCVYIKPTSRMNMVPSDLVVNAIIASTWKTALTRGIGATKDSLTVYNVCSPMDYNPLTFESFSMFKEKDIKKATNEDGIDFMFFVICTTKLSFKINYIFRHLISAYIIDFLTMLKGTKPMLVKARRDIWSTILTLLYFALNAFSFETTNFDNLADDLRSEDKNIFGWDFALAKVFEQQLIQYHLSKQTVLKPLFDDIEANRKRLRILYIMDKFSVYLTYSLVGLFLYYFSVPGLLLSTGIRLMTIP